MRTGRKNRSISRFFFLTYISSCFRYLCLPHNSVFARLITLDLKCVVQYFYSSFPLHEIFYFSLNSLRKGEEKNITCAPTIIPSARRGSVCLARLNDNVGLRVTWACH